AAQGVGTALALSCTPALATSLFPDTARVKALAGLGVAMSLASAVGPFIGGILVELWDWPAVYWVRVPIALAALALSGLLPSSSPLARPFDAPGAVMLAAAMSLLLLALVLSQRPDVGATVAVAVLLVALVFAGGYVRRAARVPEPIIRP